MNWINRAWKKSIRLANSKNMQRQFSGLILAFLLGVIIYKLVFGEIEQLSLVLGIGVSILILLFGVFKSKWVFFPLAIWLMFGQVLGEITSTIVLGVIYYLIFFPITFLIRIFKKNQDFVGWQEIKREKSDYKKLY